MNADANAPHHDQYSCYRQVIEKNHFVVQPWYESGTPETDYMQMSAAIALAAIFLLPDIQDKRPQMRFTSNHGYIIVVLSSIACASFPPTYLVWPGAIGVAGMVFSFAFPLRTMYVLGLALLPSQPPTLLGL